MVVETYTRLISVLERKKGILNLAGVIVDKEPLDGDMCLCLKIDIEE